MKFIIYVLLFTVCASCQNQTTVLEKELAKTKTELQAIKEELKNLKAIPRKVLVHEVYFNIKNDLTEAQTQDFLSGLKKLLDIPSVKNLRIGEYENMEDPRALSDYEIVMTMEFKSRETYLKYQNHPIHLSVKQEIGGYLEVPPASYDYWTKE